MLKNTLADVIGKHVPDAKPPEHKKAPHPVAEKQNIPVLPKQTSPEVPTRESENTADVSRHQSVFEVPEHILKEIFKKDL
jgi:hypothetical protein